MFSALKAAGCWIPYDPEHRRTKAGKLCLGIVDSWLPKLVGGEHLIGSAARRAPVAQRRDQTMGPNACWTCSPCRRRCCRGWSGAQLLRDGGNAIAAEDQGALRKLGAVGDICLRFFDERGKHVDSSLDDRVVGITHQALRAVPRRVAVAGGERKYTAIRAALRGGWLNVLVTDFAVAQRLADDADVAREREPPGPGKGASKRLEQAAQAPVRRGTRPPAP